MSRTPLPELAASGAPASPAGTAADLRPALLALVAGAVAMGLSPVLVRVVSPEVGPFASAFWRVALALPVLYGWMRWEEARAPHLRRVLTPSALLAGLVFSGDLLFWHLAILGTTVANATFFATTAPVFVVLFAWLGLRRRPAGRTLIGLLVCLVGGATLVGQSVQVDPARLSGDRDGVITAVFFALYFLTVERARARGLGAARVTFVASCITALVLLGAVALLETRPILPQTPGAAAGLLALALVSHAGGQGLLSVALGRLPAGFSSLVIFLEAVAAAILAWILLGEALGPLQVLGGGLILAGIATARPRRTPRDA
ncbi:DMT family transporter [Methylobacterium nonmethylotrophicum]|uniref:DMT family transporter n=1 Tax=Methylobacterium nonmethylotrophicum TaxID=1141884 RepID=A0A4Z0NG90_9HYPH|nr:DMT family transporter [Methylobacterium nonmethylotrophicum]TGD94970.1 DMT family transporter [Methylobacterium nonmethylotrophicum]